MKKVAVITGATSGIGQWIATGLLRDDYEVVIVGRNQEKLRLAQQEMKQMGGDNARVHGELANLASLDSVERLAERIRDRYPETSLLINNAGVFAAKKALSEDGIEMDMAVNHVAPFLLTWRLLPLLQQQRGSRVVNVNSDSHEKATLEQTDFDPTAPFHMGASYGKSKLANMATIVEFAARVSSASVTINAVHPGAVATNIGNVGGVLQLAWLVMKPFLITPQQGADTPLWVATSPHLVDATGNYYKKRTLTPMNPQAQRPALREMVWTRTRELARIPRDAQLIV